jgi:diadenosine tetraphosphate (Ap4A) HIT family hydrolase
MTAPGNSSKARAMLPAPAAPAAFALDPHLEADTIPVGGLALSAVLLLDDSRFPWLVLVPRRPGLTEITDLAEEDAAALMGELRLAARVMGELSRPDKINIGALGNLVPRLHLHVVGRFRSDPAWPGPVWGFGTRLPYPAHAAAALAERAASLFAAA